MLETVFTIFVTELEIFSTAPGLGDGDKGSGGRRRQTRMGNKVENFSFIRHPLWGLPRWFSG